MTDFVVLDCETVGNDRAEAYFASKKYEAPANFKDPEKIEAAIAEKRARDLEKAGLFWWTGRVICIGAYRPLTEEIRSFWGDDESAILSAFFDWFPDDCQAIGKSSEYFDCPFLVGRALAHDIGIPAFLRPKRMIQDIDHVFGFSHSCDQRSNLEAYAFGLEIAGKLGKGSEVAQMHAEKRWGDIDKYCRQDVAIVAEMLRRWCKPFKKISEVEVPFESA